ncbi:MAG TPA: ABC transporter ATP-binding protein [Streptosporangiaceae bacterium]|jgi:ATP-binding cassette subfamily B protein
MMSRPAAGRLADRGLGPGQGQPPRPERAADPAATAARLLARLRRERGRLLVILSLGTGSAAFTVAGPAMLGHATDIVFTGVIGSGLPPGLSRAQELARLRAGGHAGLARTLARMDVIPGAGVSLSRLGPVLAIAALLYLAAAGLGWAQGHLLAGLGQRAVHQLRADVQDKLSKLPLRYFDAHAHGEILSRVTGDIDNLGTALQQGLSQLVSSVLMIAGAVSMMFWISAMLAAAAVITIPLAVLLTLRVARRSQAHFGDQWDWAGSLTGHVEQAFSGHLLIQAFGRQDAARREFDRQNQNLSRATFSAQFVSGLIQPAMQFLANLNYVLIAVLGGYRVVTGSMTLGEVQAFIHYSRQFTMPITQVASQLSLLQSGLASAERVFAFLDASPQRQPAHSAPPARLARAGQLTRPGRGPGSGCRVTLEQVSFRYHHDRPLIEGFSLDAEPGQTVAIVGPSGAGKTTIVNLLMRFYEIDSGRILLDGADYRDLSQEDVRGQFGLVLQDTWLFTGTIRDNIGYGKPGATAAEIAAAAAAARVDPLAAALPDGYDTVLAAGASTLSAGQRQLITIARAFIADPAVLILDEATSHVDARTELLIQDSMARLRRGRTSFVIAHRLSTIRHADVIVVMSAGQIAEQGQHAELLARRGLYHELYSSQLQAAAGRSRLTLCPDMAAGGR